MAFTVNGIGTSVCKAGNSVTWDGGESFDAVECLVVAFLPMIPFRSIHTFDWNGMQFRMLPIRWSFRLVALAFLRRWLWGSLIIGSFFCIIGLTAVDKLLWVAIVGLLVAIASGAFLFAIGRGNRGRDCDIRRVLGPHNCGTSDPAQWKEALLQGIQDSKSLYGTDRYADGVDAMLKQRRFADAMWAARLSMVLEDVAEGERLTDLVLDHPDVQAGLDEIGDKSRLWQALFAPMPRVDMPPPEEPIVVTPVSNLPSDEHVQDKSRRGDEGIQGR